MNVRDDLTAYGGHAAGREDWESVVSAGFSDENDQGFRCLERFGDDLSLADAQLLELDDLLPA